MRVLVAMSGGVDSSVAAAVLRDAGHDVTGVTLKLWGGPSDSGCCSVSDVEDARRVAAQLGVPHYVFNFADDFESTVVAPYVQAYAGGRTPNPCVECNRSIKFGRLLERADELGFDAVATGHHARVRASGGQHLLERGLDPGKDQSYVLYMLSQAHLGRLLLPIGEMTKADVRRRAVDLGLRTATKAESMDVCFIRAGQRVDFLDERTTPRPGWVVDADGRRVARHEGVTAFTIGQRRGLGVALGERRYVVDVDAATSTVTIGEREQLLRDHADLRDPCFVDGPVPPGTEVDVQTRAHGDVVRGVVEAERVRFVVPQPRVAPGQVVAFYEGVRLLGGALAA